MRRLAGVLVLVAALFAPTRGHADAQMSFDKRPVAAATSIAIDLYEPAVATSTSVSWKPPPPP